MLAKFRQRYPQGSLVSELIKIDRGFYLVKVLIQVEQIVLATGLAGASTIEAAEDSARERAIAALIVDDGKASDDNTANTTTKVVDRTSSKEPTVTQVSLDEPKHEIVNPDEANKAEETAANKPEPISATILEPEPSTPQSNLFSGTFTKSEEVPSFQRVSLTAPTETSIIEPEISEEINFNEIKQKTDIEIKRLGWTKDDGREFLKSRYGKRTRLHLTDKELLEFLEYLEQQPTPVR